MYGGVSEAKPATPEIQAIVDKFLFLSFFLSFFHSFLLLFLFYVFQVDVGSGCFIHIKVFSGPSKKDNFELHGYQTNKTKDDKLTYFSGTHSKVI
ncbi:stefin-1-like [Mastomys coucha]|uniref:stefin-1-like n=1 Tax=Mastomys coucha TaxID=35658 RepID=UPI0012621913|nr:stefin-1-like [Mastomys coucha]